MVPCLPAISAAQKTIIFALKTVLRTMKTASEYKNLIAIKKTEINTLHEIIMQKNMDQNKKDLHDLNTISNLIQVVINNKKRSFDDKKIFIGAFLKTEIQIFLKE